MKKTAVVLLFLFALLPLNAQRMIKYITFYPVPYGSHASLTVTKTEPGTGQLMINMRTDNTEFHVYKTEIEGDFSVEPTTPCVDDDDYCVIIDGFADIRGEGTLTTTGTVKSGNDAFGGYGKAYSVSSTTYLNNAGAAYRIGSISSSGSASFNASKTLLNGVKLDKLSACASGAQWRSLRLKGSQDCKMYLTCDGSGSTGCTTPIFSCKSGYCMEFGVCVGPDSTSQSCVGNVSNAISGTRYRTASCTASGWSYTGWSGTCTCKTGYTWSGSYCLAPISGDCTCPAGQHKVMSGGKCCCENDTCGKTLANGVIGFCKCAADGVSDKITF